MNEIDPSIARLGFLLHCFLLLSIAVLIVIKVAKDPDQ